MKFHWFHGPFVGPPRPYSFSVIQKSHKITSSHPSWHILPGTLNPQFRGFGLCWNCHPWFGGVVGTQRLHRRKQNPTIFEMGLKAIWLQQFWQENTCWSRAAFVASAFFSKKSSTKQSVKIRKTPKNWKKTIFQHRLRGANMTLRGIHLAPLRCSRVRFLESGVTLRNNVALPSKVVMNN